MFTFTGITTIVMPRLFDKLHFSSTRLFFFLEIFFRLNCKWNISAMRSAIFCSRYTAAQPFENEGSLQAPQLPAYGIAPNPGTLKPRQLFPKVARVPTLQFATVWFLLLIPCREQCRSWQTAANFSLQLLKPPASPTPLQESLPSLWWLCLAWLKNNWEPRVLVLQLHSFQLSRILKT